MLATLSQSRVLCCISVQIKSYPAFAIAQYVEGSEAAETVPPVTFSPRIILSFTGFQIFAFGGGSNRWPYFQVFSSTVPLLTASAGALVSAPESLPAGAASGNCAVPILPRLASGSAEGLACPSCLGLPDCCART